MRIVKERRKNKKVWGGGDRYPDSNIISSVSFQVFKK
jgi:hypothetical protein